MEYFGLYNKPKAEVHPELTGPEEEKGGGEKEEEEKGGGGEVEGGGEVCA
jgi:hypothetical protein